MLNHLRRLLVLILIISLARLFIAPPTRADGCATLTSLGTVYSQNFNTLATTGTTNNTSTLPTGWILTETGGGARDNEQYAADDGGSSAGDAYSYGVTGNSERAFGGLRSSTLAPLFGLCLTNNTGATIGGLKIIYVGEEWRLGVAGRTDQLDFEFSTTATSLTSGSWTAVNALDFVTPGTASAGGKDGNDPANRAVLSTVITSLSLADGANVWLRWNDLDVAGADDGLAIDDFALIPLNAASTITAAKTGALATDVDGDTEADPGDTLTYTVAITSAGSATAAGLVLSDTLDANTSQTGLVSVSPVALDDSYNTLTNPTTLIISAGPTDLFANDYPGQNPAVSGLASFGGGSLLGDATTNAAGSTVSFGAGSLTVNANGSFNFTPPANFQGTFGFFYRLQNSLGPSDGLALINVDAAPTVVSTDPSSGATGITTTTNITVTFNESVNYSAASFTVQCPGGSPQAFTLASVSPSVSAVLNPSSDLPAGVVCTVTALAAQISDADSSDPPDNMVADYTFTFTIPPQANDDTYAPQIIGNVGVDTATSSNFSVLSNDQGVGLSITGFGASSAQGGTVALNTTTGAFSYTPARGFEGSDSFTYTIGSAAGSDTATVNLTVSGMLWFVNAAAAGGGDGRLSTPYNTLAAFQAVNNGAGSNPAANDNIFIYENAAAYSGGVTLLNGQRLIGQDASVSLASAAGLTAPADSFALPVTNSANGTLAILNNSGGHVIQIEDGNTIRGLTVNANSVTLLDAGILGSSDGGTTIVTEVTINTSSNGNGIILTNQGGDFTFSNGSITGSNLAGAVGIDQGTGALNFTNATISKTGGGLIAVTNKTGGSVNFTGGSITGTGLNPVLLSGVILLQNNTATTINFGAGFNITTSSGGGFFASSGGTVTIGGTSSAISASGGPALDVTNTTFSGGATLASVSSSISSGKGINLDTVTGALTLNGGSISDAVNIDFDLNGGSSNVTYAGSINNTANRSVEITGRTGGTVTLSGNLTDTGMGINIASNTGGTINLSGASKVINIGANPAVTLSTNTGAIINFTGGGLDIDTTSGTGFSATGGGTVTVQGTGNTIASATGTALNVANTTIGASGLTFQSISANGAVNGIVLNTTGSSGGLTVTGTGAAGTGGTIQNSTGSGVSLTSTSAVSLASMNISSGANDGIRGSTVTGLSLIGVQVTSNGNAAGEAGIDLTNLFGTSTWSGITVSGSGEDNVVIRNSSGALTSLSVTSSTFSNNSVIGNDGFLVEASGTASMTVSVTSSTFSANRGDHFQAAAANSGILDVVFSNNTLSGGHPTALGQGITISAATGVPGYNGTVDYNIDNNTINGAIVSAITANLGTSASGANMRGTISGNIIGTVGGFQSGSTQASGITVEAHGNGTHTTQITNNTIRQTFDRGINTLANDGNGTFNMTITGNNSSHSDGTNSREGFFLNNGSADPNIFGVPDSHFVCLSLGGAGALRNTLIHGPGAPDDFRLRQRFNSTIRLPGYSGVAADTTAVVAFVNGNNTSTIGSATVNSPPGGGFLGGAACPLP